MTLSGPAGQHTIREHNLALVMRCVQQEPRQSRAQLAKATGLTRATVSGLVDELIAGSLLIELEPDRSGRGRPAAPIVLNPQGPAGLGIEINVDYTAACVLDLSGRVRARKVVVTDNKALPTHDGLRHAVLLAEELCARAAPLAIAGATIAVPGLVDTTGRVVRVPNMPAWQEIDVAGELSARLGIVTQVENEANLAALAELWFADPGDNFLLVSGEIGVGAGIIIGGALYRGAHGRAGELGHVVVDPDGPACGCGSRGCLEQLAGQSALLRNAGITLDVSTSTAVPAGAIAALRERALLRDPATVAALTAAGSALGIAISAAINLLDIPTIILGGLYSGLGNWLCPAIAKQLQRQVLGAQTETFDLRLSRLGSNAAMLGGASCVIRGILDSGQVSSQQ